ncbi:Hsp20/alpha crystallin family protein [Methylobacter sp.]|uniref:Hsp20/alpha crystallin family protein n=1 Tax=Methylobacter sp. TaxID=2051955 RepID=UPI00120FBF9F|nr:Hsp20/alpha crystallin family protein [Methylobacter sp.]TAK61830.1 MAG: Hsp20/alpha crystallin family protein [Methylobacter sp.]
MADPNKEIDTSRKGSELMSKSPLGGLMSFDEFDNFFDDFLSRRWPRLLDWNMPSLSSETGFPRVDILDRDNDIEVQAALPGVKKENLEVSVTNQAITIRTSTKEEKKEEEKGKYFRREITQGEFQRTVSLPDNVDGEKANASFKDGILKVTIPKTEKSKRRNIEIR